MRKPELAAAIAEKADLTKEQANRVLNAVLEEITGALHRKDSVTLVGFGTFLQRHRGARTGKNPQTGRSEEHTSELQSLMRISYAVFCLKKKNSTQSQHSTTKTNTNTL